MANVPPCPAPLKAIQHYLKTATEHEKRDSVVTYYCRLYALQTAMTIDKSSPEARQFLVGLMDHLEGLKQSLASEEAIQSEVVGQAHMEHYSLKVFLFADNEDRAGRFSKNVVKSFYTAGMLFDVLGTFGELSEDLEKTKKYAKWKAAYIHRCLKNGETPIAGPLSEDQGGLEPGYEAGPGESATNFPGTSAFDLSATGPPPAQQPPDIGFTAPAPSNILPPNIPPAASERPAPAPVPQPRQPPVQIPSTPIQPVDASSLPKLDATKYQKAAKYCKFAQSSLQYEDSKTAVDNLQKALKLLTTGQDS